MGSGGSILTVPVLVYIVGQHEKVAVAGSLAVVGAISLVACLPYARRGLVSWADVDVQPGRPRASLVRVDADTMRTARDYFDTLGRFARGHIRALLGTQMLAKGHHLPNVTLVVIVNLDQGFFANDLRASERLAQSLIQVAGRAGRSHEPGEVLIQTSFPHHPLLATLITSGYAAFADAALAERAQATWPPYSHLAVLHAAARDEHRAIAFLSAASRALARHPVQCLGPAPANMLRRRNRYRYRLLLQSDTRAPLQTALGDLTQWLASGNARHDVRWSLDIDPQQDI